MNIDRREFLAAAASSCVSALTTSLLPSEQSAAPPRIRAVAFDAFVIFNPAIVEKRVEEVFPGSSVELINLWRSRQFEYTWLRTAGERYQNFWHTTQDALTYATAKMGLRLSDKNRDRLMNAYCELEVWPDVPKALEELHHRKIRMAFLTNFTADMIAANLRANGLSSFFEDHLTTDRVCTFKPGPRAYQMGVDHFGCRRQEIAFLAFAAWDAAGAKWFGYPTVWINRAGTPKEELSASPDHTSRDLGALSDFYSF